MKTILKCWKGPPCREELGNIGEDELETQDEDREAEAYKKFYKTMSKEQIDLFEAYNKLQQGGWSDEVDEAFVAGFRMGTLLMIEVFKKDQ